MSKKTQPDISVLLDNVKADLFAKVESYRDHTGAEHFCVTFKQIREVLEKYKKA